MGDIVNLNKFRKQKSRATREKQAEENRVKFGQTKTQKKLNQTSVDKAKSKLDRKKLDKPDEE